MIQNDIEDIKAFQTGEVREAQSELDKKIKAQKPTPVFIQKFEPTGATRTYIDTDRITIEYAGIELDINLNTYGNRDGKGIELRFNRVGMMSSGEIAIIPKHSGCVELKTPENLKE